MADARPDQEYAPTPSRMECWAAALLQRCSTEPASSQRTPVELERTTRRRVACAALAGIMSGGLIGGMEWYLGQSMLGGMEDTEPGAQWPYWSGFLALAGLISAGEIAFLYWNSLHGVAVISRLADTPLGGNPHARLVLHGLSRVALEFPSPRHRFYGIDPYAQMNRWRLIVMAVMYRMKVGASSFLLRVLLRRLLGRAALRSLLPLVTGPLYAAWNAVITWRIMLRAREQALGPHAIEALLAALEQEPLSEAGRHVLLHALGEMIMRHQDAHPNHVYLLARLLETFDCEHHHIDVDWPKQRHVLGRLERGERHRLLELLTAATVMVGKPHGNRRRFLEELFEACDKEYPTEKVRSWRRRFLDGEALHSRGPAVGHPRIAPSSG